MAQRAFWPIVAALAVVSATLPAHAGLFGDDDTLQSVTADCGRPDLPIDSIDSCLERVRVLSETDPSPQLEALEAQIERRADDAEDGTTAPAKPAPKVLPGTAVTNSPAESPATDPPPAQPQADHAPAPVATGNPYTTDRAATAENDPPAEIDGDDEAPPVEGKNDDRADPPPTPHAQLY